MNTVEFVEQLRSIAEELQPLTQSVVAGAATWDGTAYVRGERAKEPDPYGLTWWSILRTIAAMIEAQETPLSRKQMAYLENTLFGGMGSLNDLSLPAEDAVNRRFNEKRSRLFQIFKA